MKTITYDALMDCIDSKTKESDGVLVLNATELILEILDEVEADYGQSQFFKEKLEKFEKGERLE